MLYVLDDGTIQLTRGNTARLSTVISNGATGTHALEFGKYVYDVQIITEASDVYTVIGPCTFEILKEVTY